jgi:hypothetical protein
MQRIMQSIWELSEFIFAKTLGVKPDHDIKGLTLSELTEAHYNQTSDKARTLLQHLFGVGG